MFRPKQQDSCSRTVLFGCSGRILQQGHHRILLHCQSEGSFRQENIDFISSDQYIVHPKSFSSFGPCAMGFRHCELCCVCSFLIHFVTPVKNGFITEPLVTPTTPTVSYSLSPLPLYLSFLNPTQQLTFVGVRGVSPDVPTQRSSRGVPLFCVC